MYDNLEMVTIDLIPTGNNGNTSLAQPPDIM